MKYQVLSIKYLTTGFIFFILYTLYLILNTGTAHAASKTDKASQILRITPIIINVPLSPGKTYRYPVTIQNASDTPLPLQTTLNDFLTTGEEGGYVFPESHSNPLLSWVSLSETEFILNPQETKTITLTINTPKTIPLGGYYGMLFFQPVLQDTSQVTHIVPKVGLLMLANVGVQDPKAKTADILTFSTGLLHEDNQVPFLLRVKNISLHFFTAKPILTISPLFPLHTQPPKPVYLQEKIIFQGKIRRWEQTLNIPEAVPNIYKLHLVLATGNGQDTVQDTYFIIFPFIKAGAILLLFITTVFFVTKRKQIKKFFKALAGK